MTRTILTLCGGIGGAKLVYGLSQIFKGLVDNKAIITNPAPETILKREIV